MRARFFPPGGECQGITRYAYRKLSQQERQHFMFCCKCGHYFDRRRLDQSVAHSFLDHNACSPVARRLSGFRGKPVAITAFKGIPRGQTAIKRLVKTKNHPPVFDDKAEG
jgi:hypothetical protein